MLLLADGMANIIIAVKHACILPAQSQAATSHDPKRIKRSIATMQSQYCTAQNTHLRAPAWIVLATSHNVTIAAIPLMLLLADGMANIAIAVKHA
eukprot:4480553-Karenia_brevis.AAC.1